MSTKTPRYLSAAAAISVVVSLICLALLLLATSFNFLVSEVLGLSLLWVPIGLVLGLYVLLRGTIIIGREPAVEERKRLKRIALLGACGAFLSIALVVCLSAIPTNGDMAPREAIVNDLNNIAANAYEYRLRPHSASGGNGSYLGYSIPRRMADATRGFHYSVVALWPDSIICEGRYENHQNGAIRVKIDSEGRSSNWRYFGDMDY